ncbi:MAG: ribonuclease Y [Planctomycetota bacterium]|nr:MAG: ribonuclease Y [Planctomycetota bacterium]
MGYIGIGAIVGILFGMILTYLYLLVKANTSVREAEERSKQILKEAEEKAEQNIRQAQQEFKEELAKKKQEFEAELQERQKEIRFQEKRLAKREDNIDKKLDLISKKERTIDEKEEFLKREEKKLKELQSQAEKVLEDQNRVLQKISGLSRNEAIEFYLSRLEKEVEHEAAKMISRIMENAKEEATIKARKILATTIQRVAVDHTREAVVSTIDLPNDEMKGRIIGREGRNIRAFEQITGVDVIVDDTPGVVVVSCFDSVRREVARRAMEKLVLDGRIHPARIEEVVEDTKKEVNEMILEAGKQAIYEVGITNIHPKMVQLLGRLRFRTSYGQNVLKHSIECALLAGALAGELGLDVTMAKRCALLHDIGKAVDHDMEGGHPAIGANLAKRYDEPKEVINAIASHHEDVPMETIYSVITQVCDAISGSRPGARGESLERYIKRLEQLENIASEFQGVKQAYAIQAGREVRVFVSSDKVNDKMAAKICRDIAKKIEKEMTYPGEIKITLVREVRVTEYAR